MVIPNLASIVGLENQRPGQIPPEEIAGRYIHGGHGGIGGGIGPGEFGAGVGMGPVGIERYEDTAPEAAAKEALAQAFASVK